MRILNWLFAKNKLNKRIDTWAKSVPYNVSQRSVMWELWYSAMLKQLPKTDPLASLNNEDRTYLMKICSATFRPKKFGSCDELRQRASRFYLERGFTEDQVAIIVGMHFNRIGRPNLHVQESLAKIKARISTSRFKKK